MVTGMKFVYGLAMAAMLFCATAAQAGEAELEQCQSEAENPNIRAANCDLAIRLGGLTPGQLSVALFNRGQAYLILSKPDQAMVDFDALLKLDPDDSEALFVRAIARRQLKQYDGAIADFDRLLTLNYQPAAMIYFNRSIAYYNLGDEKKTLTDLRQANVLDPKNRVIEDRLWKTERFYQQQQQRP